MQISVTSALRSPSRIAALRETALLDTPPEEPFDGLAELTGSALGTAVTISLLDGEREFLKATVGLAEPWASRREIPIGDSLCRHLVSGSGPLVIPDARKDDRVAESASVTEMGIVAYAGVPVRAPDGEVLGGVSALDRASREWSAEELTLLARVARAVAGEVELRIELQRARSEARAARSQAEAQLPESEERYRLVSHATSDIILDWDIATGRLLWNGAGPEMLRYTPREAGSAIGWLYEHIHPEDRERIAREHEALLGGVATSWASEYRFLRGDGRYATLLQRSFVSRDERGRPLRMLSSLMDVTERREAEEAQRFLARASALLDSSLDYEATLASLARLIVPTLADYCLIDLLEPDGSIRRVATAHADPTREHLLLKNESVPMTEDPERHPVVRVVRSGEPVFVPECTTAVLDRIAHDQEHRRRLEEIGLCSFIIVPLVARDEPVGAMTLAAADSSRSYRVGDLVLAGDLARRASLAIERARLFGEAREAVEDREEVLGFVSHDLRNPLNTIQLAANFLLETAKERRSGNRKWIEMIQRASEQMSTLIDDLLRVDSLEAGGFSLVGSPQQVPEVVDGAREMLEPLAASKRIRLSSEVAPGLPPVWMDPDQILRVISNLVGNAIKFTPAGGAITLRAERSGDEVHFAVSDTGPGIPGEQLPHVFDRYWQARRGDRRGSGLGLAIARGIVKAHGGRIWVESTEGKGATFFFSIPCR